LHAKYLEKRLFISNIIIRTHTHWTNYYLDHYSGR